MTMEADPHAGAIVSDVGGVLLADGMRTMIELLGHRFDVPTSVIDRKYRDSGLREQLWTGTISTRTFWNELGILISHPLGAPEELDAQLVKACEPLAAMSVIEEVLDRLWLATNHRMEWLMPALEVSGLQLDPNRIVCSSAVGSCKPDPTFYAHVASLVGTETILGLRVELGSVR